MLFKFNAVFTYTRLTYLCAGSHVDLNIATTAADNSIVEPTNHVIGFDVRSRTQFFRSTRQHI